MSGLEIAGAVLGSIPLVISAIEHYANGISTARRYLKYQTEMEDLLRKIRTEQKLFKNTIETLLNGIASDERMSDIVAGGNFWQEPDIELKLKDRLRDAYDIYLDNVCGMEASLQRFREKLALDQAGKVRHHSSCLIAGSRSTESCPCAITNCSLAVPNRPRGWAASSLAPIGNDRNGARTLIIAMTSDC